MPDEPGRPERRTDSGAVPAAQPGWLSAIPTSVKMLELAANAVLALLTSRLLIPEQLSQLRISAFPLALLAVLTSWVAHRSLRRWLAPAIASATVLLAVLLFLNQRYVVSVTYVSPRATANYLIGTGLTPFGEQVAAGLGSPSPEEIIRETGADMIPSIWDRYWALQNTYAVAFILFVFIGCLAVSGGLSHGGRGSRVDPPPARRPRSGRPPDRTPLRRPPSNIVPRK